MEVQQINFNKFSDPILIPQFKKYLVKFEGSSKTKKNPTSEKLEFVDSTGKSYIFNSEDVQKSDNSDYYINLHTLRRYYDIKFESDFERFKPELSDKEIQSLISKSENFYQKDSSSFSKFKNKIEQILQNKFNNNVGEYRSTPCDKNITGILNIFPKKESVDDNGNTWSILNQIPYNLFTLRILLTIYIREFKTFEHNDFISWLEKNPTIITEDLIDRLVKEASMDDDTNRIDSKMLQKIFNTKDIFFVTCPNEEKKKNLMVVYYQDKPMKIQLVDNKSKNIFYNGETYKVLVKNDEDKINYDADFILFRSGMLFINNKTLVVKLPRRGETDPQVNFFLFQTAPLIGTENIVNT